MVIRADMPDNGFIRNGAVFVTRSLKVILHILSVHLCEKPPFNAKLCRVFNIGSSRINLVIQQALFRMGSGASIQ